MGSILRSNNYKTILYTPEVASLSEGQIRLIGDTPAVAFQDEVAGVEQTYITEAELIEVAKKTHATDEAIAAGGKIGFNSAGGNSRDYESGDICIGWGVDEALSTASTVLMRFKPQL